MNSSPFTYKRIEQNDKQWIDEFIAKHWGSSFVVVHNTLYYPNQLDGYIAYHGNEIVGLITYQIKEEECEIVTLNSLIQNSGVGSSLVKLVEKEAKEKGIKNIWLITTNDNLRAIGFYQRIGFQLVNVFPNAVEDSRRLKPEILLLADNKIPIRDELKFCLRIAP